MFHGNEDVTDYLKSIVRKPEGMIAVLFSILHIFIFIMFNEISELLLTHYIINDLPNRIIFLIMPIAILVTLLRMDIKAESRSDRALTMILVVFVALLPLYYIVIQGD